MGIPMALSNCSRNHGRVDWHGGDIRDPLNLSPKGENTTLAVMTDWVIDVL